MIDRKEVVNDIMSSQLFKDKLKILIEEVVKQTVDSIPDPNDDGLTDYTNRNRKLFLKALGELDVQEWRNGSNPRVELYLDHGARKDNGDSGLQDDTPWCAGFVAYCLEKVDMTSTDSLRARSYEFWGVSSKDDPQPGDIVTFWRGKKYIRLKSINDWGPGHVGFFVRENSTHVWVLGGNQSDEVNITRYSKSRMTDIRRSIKQQPFSSMQISELRKLSYDVMAENSAQDAGSVV